MSWLSKEFKKIGSGAKRLVTDPGKWAENAGRSVGATARTIAPALSIVPGVGPGAAAAISALGNVAAGGNRGSTIKSGLTTYGVGQLLSGVPGVDAVGSKLGSGLSRIPGVSSAGSALAKLPGASAFLPSSATPVGMDADAANLMRLTPNGANAAVASEFAGSGAGASSLPSSLSSRVTSALGSVGSAAKENPLVVGQIASGVLGARQQGEQNALQREQFDYERQLSEDERKRKQNTASLLAPLFQQYLTKAGQSDPWSNYTPYTPFRGASA